MSLCIGDIVTHKGFPPFTGVVKGLEPYPVFSDDKRAIVQNDEGRLYYDMEIQWDKVDSNDSSSHDYNNQYNGNNTVEDNPDIIDVEFKD